MTDALPQALQAAEAALRRTSAEGYAGELRVGVDLGTAYTVVLVLNETGVPVVGASRFAEVVRDGVVVDFVGASALVRELKGDLETRLGRRLEAAATAYPPGVPVSEVRANRYVLEAAGLTCTALVEEPVAANSVLGMRDGAVVDVGGGTTGIAVIEGGEVIRTADEPTGGTHLTLVLAGAHRIPFEHAEALKTDPGRRAEVAPLIRPVLEKIASIVAGHLRDHDVDVIHLVGGTSAVPELAGIVTAHTGVPVEVPPSPLLVTPLGVALHDGAARADAAPAVVASGEGHG